MVGGFQNDRENTLDISPFHYPLQHLEKKEVKHIYG